MTIYRCPRCGYSSHIKTYLRKHFLRKRKCITSINDISIEEYFKQVLHEEYEKSNIEPKMNPNESKKNYKCKLCNKIYSTNSHMNRHMKKCSTMDLSDNTKVINYIK